MNKKKWLIAAAAALVLLIGGAALLYDRLSEDITPDQMSSSNETSEEGGEEAVQKVVAPDFTVYDAEGNEVTLSEQLGKPVIVNFWASWCGPCKSEMPDFEDAYQEYQDTICFMMLNMTDGAQETVESASDFIAQQGYTFPVYYDTAADAAITYGARSLPTTFFIDAEGYAIAQAVGAINRDVLQQGIDMILPK